MLRCPDCGSENVKEAHLGAFGTNDKGVCRDCFNKEPIERFIDTYNNFHDTDGEPEWTAEMKYSEEFI